MEKHLFFDEVRHSKKENILFRPRIQHLLETAASRPLITITAGTGYGKSQAVNSYLEHTGYPYIWLQLTALDNYPGRFWDLFTRAMHSLDPAVARSMATIGFPASMEKTYTFLRDFVSSISQHEHCVLVLDDFHKIEDASIIHFVETLCFSAIEGLTIFLVSRSPLMLDYSALQAEGLISNINIADLRFTTSEAAAFYEMLGIHLPDDTFESIYHATEGWPLAIYLIGLHQKKGGNLFEDPVDCTIPMLYTLIESEVYNEYPPRIQRIFIKLSLMEGIPLELVQHISGDLYADVADLMRHNMFVTYNPQTECYHFHRIFRRFLAEKQILFSDDELHRTYQLIGDHYREQGKLLEALVFYEKCEGPAKIWQIIRSAGGTLSASGYTTLCIRLMDSFPPEFIEANPMVRVMRAHLLLHAGNIELAYRHNLTIRDEIAYLPPTPAREELLGEVCLQLAHLSIMNASYEFEEMYLEAARLLPGGSSLVMGTPPYVGNNTALNLFKAETGEVDRMLATLNRVMPQAYKTMNGLGTGVHHLAAAEAAFFQAKFLLASQKAREAVDAAGPAGQYDVVYNAMQILLRVNFALGDAAATLDDLEAIRIYARQSDRLRLIDMYDILEGWFLCHIGQPAKVAGWITAPSFDLGNKFIFNIGRERLVRAYWMFLTGEYYELLALLESIEQQYRQRSLFFMLLHVPILQALCHHRLGNIPAATAGLEKAYALTEPDRLYMPLIEYASDMHALIEAVRARTTLPPEWLDHISTQAAAYGRRKASIETEYARRNKLEASAYHSLTRREREILTCLCQGLTREEIASSLAISINTVKTTLKNIFSKLGAINRADAIRIAIDDRIVEL